MDNIAVIQTLRHKKIWLTNKKKESLFNVQEVTILRVFSGDSTATWQVSQTWWYRRRHRHPHPRPPYRGPRPFDQYSKRCRQVCPSKRSCLSRPRRWWTWSTRRRPAYSICSRRGGWVGREPACPLPSATLWLDHRSVDCPRDDTQQFRFV